MHHRVPLAKQVLDCHSSNLLTFVADIDVIASESFLKLCLEAICCLTYEQTIVTGTGLASKHIVSYPISDLSCFSSYRSEIPYLRNSAIYIACRFGYGVGGRGIDRRSHKLLDMY